MKKYFLFAFIISSGLIVTGCSSNSSEQFMNAGCAAADSGAFDEAAIQFDLAAENGDPGAVSAALSSRKIWSAFMTAGSATSYEDVKATGRYVARLAKGIDSYCPAEYEIE